MSEEKTIACQGEGCGREAYEEDEDYYTCGRCGWAGSSNNPVVVLEREVKRLRTAIANVAGFPKRCPPKLKLKGVIDAMVCMLREASE